MAPANQYTTTITSRVHHIIITITMRPEADHKARRP
jgi:hypothetical protein